MFPSTDETPLLTSLSSKIEPFIVPCLTHSFPSSFIEESRKKIREILRNALPRDLHFEDKKDFFSWLLETAPLIHWTKFETLPDCFSVFLICPNAGKVLQPYQQIPPRNVTGRPLEPKP